ncbi:N-acetylmuramoyl-L-alanine amidase family protein [Crassaminicella profunda]|uniref:N-acetylmuramoyl-L-alanine amidase family protein n=1 Tax=Crassaminicella profunda TaxID=1286698 RepID=UPI001CA6C555|nr:N-acetylmuramoyl-L-alanine amidase [Crassaminicella profunda]QZY56335.1 N-acetylmuramoyl-L-alanine amidase [Crassaminicella profunda]
MKPLIIIDPGHGGKDPGGGSNEYWLEKDMALEISKYQYKRLSELGISVQLTRNNDMYLSSSKRSKIVRDSEAKYCISNHINAGGGQGAETIHSIHSDGKLATKILDKIRQTGQKTRRVFSKTLSHSPNLDYYFMHRETGNVETVIVEYGFADQKEDIDRILKHWKDYAEAVVKAICEYMGYSYENIHKMDEDRWKYAGVEYLHTKGILNDLEGWKEKINEPMPVWATTLLLKKIFEKLKEED